MGSSHLLPAPVIYLVEPFGGSIRRQNASMPHVFWDDAAVTRGDGIFETILIRKGVPANLEAHIERFRRSARTLDLPDPGVDHWVKATNEAVADYVRERGSEPEEVDARCVWTMTRGRETTGVPTAWLTVRPIDETALKQRKSGVSVMTTSRGYSLDTGEHAVPWMQVGAKTLNYAANMAALRWAKSHGHDDVIYIDPTTERVLEGANSTVIVVKKGGRIRTPKPGPGILPGTTQAALFEYASERGWKCKQKDIYLNELFKAESVWLVSSTRMATRVKRLNDKKLPAPENAREIQELVQQALDASLGL
ncbi:MULTISPECIES: aminodeoxychorismate lyase [Corynebacterium]|uniref:aminodeoxychorismate lyase n=1 Tax=Corynebacterium TaxID=1716 RepID=UPI0008A39FC7|nr:MULTISPECIES: aminodeoxychorismate lyase [Corynebacterium]MCQ4608716.1 aminodeoxychorismate lyase [Corynebacterium pseudogenitalium]MCQ4610193.1 aminodeoxychorismate lyase [Corynebacterium sp. CCUG 61414]MCQ4612321.1 aminodeoxychorismate lyase [Corynebacterium sp. CCUG 51687]OFT30361.1 4-amino-4-deoxychorismate lyase [Corynebacterium sp. HMSC08D02]UUA86898.1 aminodeoxychorismate lyase [Corynebacterium pseudogenitalium]